MKANTMTYKFDNYEMHPVRTVLGAFNDDASRIRQGVEVCQPAEAEFWSVYGHLTTGGVDCLCDFDDRSAAVVMVNELNALLELTGLRHSAYVGIIYQPQSVDTRAPAVQAMNGSDTQTLWAVDVPGNMNFVLAFGDDATDAACQVAGELNDPEGEYRVVRVTSRIYVTTDAETVTLDENGESID